MINFFNSNTVKKIEKLSISVIFILILGACSHSTDDSLSDTKDSTVKIAKKEKYTDDQREVLDEYAETLQKWINSANLLASVKMVDDNIVIVVGADVSNGSDDTLQELSESILANKTNTFKVYSATEKELEEPLLIIQDMYGEEWAREIDLGKMELTK